MEPTVWRIIEWAIGLNAAVVGILLTAFYFISNGKANKEAFQLFVESGDKRFETLLQAYRGVKETQISILSRMTRAEDCNEMLAQSNQEIKLALREINSELRQVNGGVLGAIKVFQESNLKQMELNQALLVARKKEDIT